VEHLVAKVVETRLAREEAAKAREKAEKAREEAAKAREKAEIARRETESRLETEKARRETEKAQRQVADKQAEITKLREMLDALGVMKVPAPAQKANETPEDRPAEKGALAEGPSDEKDSAENSHVGRLPDIKGSQHFNNARNDHSPPTN